MHSQPPAHHGQRALLRGVLRQAAAGAAEAWQRQCHLRLYHPGSVDIHWLHKRLLLLLLLLLLRLAAAGCLAAAAAAGGGQLVCRLPPTCHQLVASQRPHLAPQPGIIRAAATCLAASSTVCCTTAALVWPANRQPRLARRRGRRQALLLRGRFEARQQAAQLLLFEGAGGTGLLRLQQGCEERRDGKQSRKYRREAEYVISGT